MDSRSLLKHIYKVYFKYASNLFSVVNLLDRLNKHPWEMSQSNPNLTAFLYLLTSTENRPLFDKLCDHLLVFAAKNDHGLENHRLFKLEDLWQRLSIKFLAYTDHQQQEAEKLMECLVTHLVDEDGLSLAPFGHADTFYRRLEEVIDNAIANHTLPEQLTEIGGTSLLWTGALFAIREHFPIVCREMKLQQEDINVSTQSYCVSLDELINTLKKHQPGEGFLKTALFRYLGKERFREDLAFYRELYSAIKKSEHDANATYVQELLLVYYALATTGMHYGARPQQESFSSDFIYFLQNNPSTAPLEKTLVLATLNKFFEHLPQVKTDAQKGSTMLWSLWQEKNISILGHGETSIPDVLKKKFERTQLKHFLLRNSTALKQCAPLLNSDPELAYTLIKNWFGEPQKAQFDKTSLILLKSLYPQLTMTTFINDLMKIITFIDAYALLAQRGGSRKLFVALKKIVAKKISIEHTLEVLDLLSNEMAEDKNNLKKDPLAALFLTELASPSQSSFLNNITSSKPILALILNYYLTVKLNNVSLPLLFRLGNTLMSLGIERTTQTLTLLLKTMRNKEGYLFFSENSQLTAQQWESITLLITQVGDLDISLAFIQFGLQKNPELDFITIQNELKNLSQEHSKQIVFISHLICSATSNSLLEWLEQLKKLPASTLNQLVQLHNLHAIQAPQFLELLASPSIPEAIAQFERAQYATNQERYHYSHEDVSKKIAQIKYKSPTGEELSLSAKSQQKYLHDYEKLMSYMTKNPILIEQNREGVSKEFTIYELTETQFHTLSQRLFEQIKKGINRYDHQLMLLALSCEALYRTTHKFPKNTQILPVINTLNQKKNLIHEAQTGEGKSIIGALHAVTLFDGKNIDITTENDQLARELLNKFRPFFNYFKIPCAADIIKDHSPYSAYVMQGINCSTDSNLALFKACMKLEKKPLPNASLICDEIDAALTSTIQFRLAATIDPLLLDTKSWSAVYSTLLNFVKEKEIFCSNKCSNEADIINFKTYFCSKNPGKHLIDFINKLSKKLLNTVIDSAVAVHTLKEKVDYEVVTITQDGETTSYAAPYVNNRPNPLISCGNHTQQLLHQLLNNEKPKYPFKMDPPSETLIVVSSKNFFDSYRLNGGFIIGLTATAGSPVELKEFYNDQRLNPCRYPPFQDNRCEHLGLFAAFGSEAHQNLILKTIQEYRSPEQPILIITNSPQESECLGNYLREKTNWDIQTYSGYAHLIPETRVIQRAGEQRAVTVASKCLTRGTDIIPKAKLFVVLTCLGTKTEEDQALGRTARHGNEGQGAIIIDATGISSPTSTLDEIKADYRAHQHALSEQQQRQRLKTRLLEESNYLIIYDYLLTLRERADQILSRQYGRHSVLVSWVDLMQTLSGLNQRAEQYYAELLEKHGRVDGSAADEFLQVFTTDYQRVLEQWLPNERFKNFTPIEPLIPLENLKTIAPLNTVKMEQLTLFSELLSKGWEHAGHQKMQSYFARMDKLLESLNPYFREECSLQTAVAEALQAQNIVDEPTAMTAIESVEAQGFELIRLATTIPIVGSFIPVESVKNYLTHYLTTTKTQIKEKKWDDLRLPQIDFSPLSAMKIWVNRISTVMTMSSLVMGGPITFIINKVVIPTLISWITSFFKNRFANSDSTYLQVIAGLVDVSSDLSNAISALTSLSDSQPLSVGIFIDKIAPLLKNKALLNLAIKYLELNNQAHLIPYVQVIPEFLKSLEPYREKPFRELLTMKTLMPLFHQACQFEFVKKAFEDTEFKDILARISTLTPELLSAFSHLRLDEFLGLVKVIAHPNFYNFIKKLPPQATVAELIVWLAAPEVVPVEIKDALDELTCYQSNRERMIEDSRTSLLALKDKFSLSSDKIKAVLASQAPSGSARGEEKKDVLWETLIREETPPVIAPAPAPTPQTPWLKYAAIALGLTLLVLLNIFFFSVTVLLTSLTMVAWLAYPLIKAQIITLFASQSSSNLENNTPSLEKQEKPVEPIVIEYFSKPKESMTAPMDNPVSIKNEPEATQSKIQKTAYNQHGLFKSAEETLSSLTQDSHSDIKSTTDRVENESASPVTPRMVST